MSQQAKTGDRRGGRRFIVAGCVAWVSRSGWLGSLGFGARTFAEVLDLGTRGARIRLSGGLPLFQTFVVMLGQQQGIHKVRGIRARTAWVRADGTAGMHQVGLQFLPDVGRAEGVKDILCHHRTQAQPA